MLNLQPTLDLHQKLAELLPLDEASIRAALQTANEELSESRLTFGRVKPLAAAMTALLLKEDDIDQLKNFAETMHGVVEKVLDEATRTPENLNRYFPDHARLFPFLARTLGSPTWQVVSRYDVAVTPSGDLKLMELNTGCPGGFLIADAMSNAARHGFAQLKGLCKACGEWQANGTIPANALPEALLALEADAGITTETIAVLNDENDLLFELDLLVDALRKQGRQVVRSDAAALHYRNEKLLHGDQVVSLTYNKFRISTPNSTNHCWKHGFEKRYANYLEAQKQRDVVSVNNVGGMLLAEDKSLLAAMHSETMQELLTEAERQLVEMHVLWTAKLQPGQVRYQNETVDLYSILKQNKDGFVIKPCNEGRGFGVVVGKAASEAEWIKACQPDNDIPKIVQEYAESVSFPVISLGQQEASEKRSKTKGRKLHVRPMLLTLGLALLRGEYHGLVSRVSANAVTNVAREGFGQGVLVCE